MMSLRSMARAAPRALPRASASAAGITLRHPIMQRAALLSLRPAAITSHVSLSTSSAFSTSAASQKGKRAQQGDTSGELVAKIESELMFEEEAAEKDQLPSSIKDWLENSPFELLDIPGEQAVKLTREYKGEKITVRFSIGDIDNFNDMYNDEMNEDGLDEEGLEVDEDAPTKKQRGTPSRPAIEESLPEDEESFDNDLDDEESVSPPLHLSIVIEKPGRAPGALAIDAACDHGSLTVENMAYYPDATVARGETPEALAAQQQQYSGPPFASLDEDLQNVVDTFLHERGITSAMAIFASDYVDVKEQREYIWWLNQIKKFASA